MKQQYGTEGNASRLTPWSRAVLAVLEEHGDWMPQKEVMARVMPTVPPGIALRTTENLRRSSGMGKAPEKRVRPRPESALIASGQRVKASEAVNSMINNGRVERKVEGDVKYLRLVNPMPRVLVVQDNGEVTIGLSGEVQLVDVNSSKLPSMPLDELKQLRISLELLPNRLAGRFNAMSMVNTAILLKEHDNA